MTVFHVFHHLTAPKAELYRAVIGALMEAKSTFRLHVRPHELMEAVSSRMGPVTEDVLDTALRQLCDWGNIESHPDTGDASTVEEFLRPRFLYQLSRAGEAAEASVRHYEALLAKAAQLQSAALVDVRALLSELALLADAEEPDQGKVHLTLRNIWMRFGELTSEAQSFLGALQRTIDLRGTDLVGLVAYKQRLIDYLERFIRDLVVVGSDIADHLRRLDPSSISSLLLVAARRDVADMLGASDDDKQRAEQQWLQRWQGLSSWFLGTADGIPLVETLRARARAAIPALLSAIASVNESRLTRTDRVADLRALARWFAECESDEDAHRLWRVSFGLSPARHLPIDDQTLMDRDQRPVSAHTSWLDAPALFVSPRFRATGRHERIGIAPTVLDCSEGKALLAKLARDEALQIAAARERLAALGQVRLSQMRALDRAEFPLFLDLLGQALTRKTRQDEPVDIVSTDGTMRITLEPVGNDDLAIIQTSDGQLAVRDHALCIERSDGAEFLTPPHGPVTEPAIRAGEVAHV